MKLSKKYQLMACAQHFSWWRSVILLLKKGTEVDATLIPAPSSTKNKDKARDPEMHSSQKGRQWHFGIKAHIGAGSDFGLVHTVRTGQERSA